MYHLLMVRLMIMQTATVREGTPTHQTAVSHQRSAYTRHSAVDSCSYEHRLLVPLTESSFEVPHFSQLEAEGLTGGTSLMAEYCRQLSMRSRYVPSF